MAGKKSHAVACGCTCVIKPAEQTRLTVLYMGSLIKEVREFLLFVCWSAYNMVGKIGPAVFCGCTCVIKSKTEFL